MNKIGLCLTIEPYAGGAYQYWISILEALVRESRTHKYELVLFADKRKWEKIAEEYHLKIVDYTTLGNNINFAINKIMEKILSPNAYHKFCTVWLPNLKKIERENVKIWISENPKIIAKAIGAKSIVSVFDLMHVYEPHFEEVQADFNERERSNKLICDLADMILVDSNVGKRQLKECYESYVKDIEEKTRVLPFVPANYIFQKKEAVNFIPPFDKYIFYPAQFWKHKNHERLLKAIALLKKEKGITVNLVCVGSRKNADEDVRRVLEETKLQNQVKILGYVSNEETVSLYRNARALVYPSLLGPTNIPPLEAFALGCPVAISNYYAMPEQVGDAALLFDPKSIEEIASCIELLWTNDDLCMDLINKGYARSKSWGKEAFSHTLAQYIDELLED